MPELRKDYLTNEWVSMAEGRAKRPMIFGTSGKCPFCSENRHMLSGILYENDGVIVLPNLYPILSDEKQDGYGFHEVIIDTAEHDKNFFDFEQEKITEVLSCIKDRLLFYSQNEKIKYVQVFKNNGVNAGASIIHSHWQLLAMSLVPSRIETILYNAEKYFEENKECYHCSLIKNLGEYKICENKDFVAYTPYASKFNYEVCIMAKNRLDFTLFSHSDIVLLASMLKIILNGLQCILKQFDYNILFYNENSIHFYIQIIPRIGRIAGCELSSGLFTNSVYPEDAAQVLRELCN